MKNKIKKIESDKRTKNLRNGRDPGKQRFLAQRLSGMCPATNGYVYSDGQIFDGVQGDRVDSEIGGLQGVYALKPQTDLSPRSLSVLESMVLSGVAVFRQSKDERVFFVRNIEKWREALGHADIPNNRFFIYLRENGWEIPGMEMHDNGKY